MKVTKTSEIVKKLKAMDRGEKVNITFRLSRSVIERFKKACEQSDVMPGAVIEELMLEFASSK